MESSASVFVCVSESVSASEVPSVVDVELSDAASVSVSVAVALLASVGDGVTVLVVVLVSLFESTTVVAESFDELSSSCVGGSGSSTLSV